MIEINQSGNTYYFEVAKEYSEMWYMFVAWGALGVASAVGYFITFVRKGAEKAGEISSSWFGYRLLIPIYGYSLLLEYNYLDFMTVVIFALMIIGYIIYRRGFKLKVSDYIVTACGIPVFLLGGLLQ